MNEEQRETIEETRPDWAMGMLDTINARFARQQLEIALLWLALASMSGLLAYYLYRARAEG